MFGLAACGSSTSTAADASPPPSPDGSVTDGSAILTYDLRPPGDLVGPPSGACVGTPKFTEAIHVIIDVTWPSTPVSPAGTGKVHLWTKSELMAMGTALTGQMQPCGAVFPEVPLSGPAMIAAGGSRVLVDVPDAVWDAPGVPRFPVMGSQAMSIGGAVELQWSVRLGVTLSDPRAPWPDSYQMLTTVDIDKDGSPGYTVSPSTSAPYVLPPTSLMVGTPPLADRLYLASRDYITISGTRSSCFQQSGTADVSFLDGHVVGCHVKSGADCTPTQTDFMDAGRLKFQVKSATFESRRVSTDATCAEIRNVMPVM
jgi:prepilin-type processing-associated H-X9-DG protein